MIDKAYANEDMRDDCISEFFQFRASDICNFGRTPMPFFKNPLWRTARSLVLEWKYSTPNVYTPDDCLPKSFKDYPIYDYHVGRNKPTLGDIHGVDVLDKYPFSAKFEPWVHEKPLEQWEHHPDEIFSHDYVGLRDLDFYAMDSIDRISGLIDSIHTHGYDPHKFDSFITIDVLSIDAEFLGDENETVYIADGHHRVAALIALEKRCAPADVQLIGRVRSWTRGVEDWEAVKADDPILTKAQAEIILNRYVDV